MAKSKSNTGVISSFLSRLSESAKASSNEPRHLKAGVRGRQGDIYVHPIDKIPAAWDKRDPSAHPQVAVGDTMGSRHTVDGAAVQVFWASDKEKALEQVPFDFFKTRELAAEAKRVLLGPVLSSTTEFVIDHPEHPKFIMPAGTYLVTYQFDELTRGAVSD